MNSITFTRDAIVDLPKIRKQFTLRDFAKNMANVTLLVFLFLVAQQEQVARLGVNPLVLAFVFVVLVNLPFHVAAMFRQSKLPRPGIAIVVGSIILMIFLLLMVNEPLWVKRVISVTAGIEVFMLTSTFLTTPIVQARNPEWNGARFTKANSFHGTLALVSLVVNETAIYLGDDWLWIASRAAFVVLTPLVIFLTAMALVRPEPDT